MPLTIIAYHYVRDAARSRFPAINARSVPDFRLQLDHLARHYEVVTAEQVIAAAQGEAELPDNAAWLTFDDGYLDHFTNVFPLLDERGWQGSFFVPAVPILERRVLDVNKIHFVLASTGPERVLALLRARFDEVRREDAELAEWQDYWERHGHATYWATAEIIFIKQMLQRALPEAIRTRILGELFAELVSADEATFADELYASTDQLRLMARSGMHLGSHGHGHYWLNALSRAEQEREVDLSLQFLKELGMAEGKWVMCYPYGGFDATTVDVVRAKGCAVGLTTHSAIADLRTDSPLELPRIDTNDIAPTVAWRSDGAATRR